MQKLSSAYSSFSCNLNSQQNYFYSRIPNLIRLKLYWLHISNIAYFSFPANFYFLPQIFPRILHIRPIAHTLHFIQGFLCFFLCFVSSGGDDIVGLGVQVAPVTAQEDFRLLADRLKIFCIAFGFVGIFGGVAPDSVERSSRQSLFQEFFKFFKVVVVIFVIIIVVVTVIVIPA